MPAVAVVEEPEPEPDQQGTRTAQLPSQGPRVMDTELGLADFERGNTLTKLMLGIGSRVTVPSMVSLN